MACQGELRRNPIQYQSIGINVRSDRYGRANQTEIILQFHRRSSIVVMAVYTRRYFSRRNRTSILTIFNGPPIRRTFYIQVVPIHRRHIFPDFRLQYDTVAVADPAALQGGGRAILCVYKKDNI